MAMPPTQKIVHQFPPQKEPRFPPTTTVAASLPSYNDKTSMKMMSTGEAVAEALQNNTSTMEEQDDNGSSFVTDSDVPDTNIIAIGGFLCVRAPLCVLHRIHSHGSFLYSILLLRDTIL